MRGVRHGITSASQKGPAHGPAAMRESLRVELRQTARRYQFEVDDRLFGHLGRTGTRQGIHGCEDAKVRRRIVDLTKAAAAHEE